MKSGQELEAGAEPEAMEEHCLLPMACSAFFLIQPRTTCLGMSPLIVGWAFPHKSVIEKALQTWPTGQSNKDTFSVGVPSFQVTLARVKLQKTNPIHIGYQGFGVSALRHHLWRTVILPLHVRRYNCRFSVF